MYDNIKQLFQEKLNRLEESWLYKKEHIITAPQGSRIDTKKNKSTLNFCTNNCLGLSANPDVIDTRIAAMKAHGYGLSSVRLIEESIYGIAFFTLCCQKRRHVFDYNFPLHILRNISLRPSKFSLKLVSSLEY